MSRKPSQEMPTLRIDPKLAEALKGIDAGMARLAQDLRTQFQGVAEGANKALLQVLSVLKDVSKHAEMFQRFVKEMPPRVLEVHRHITALGWHGSDFLPISAFTALSKDSTPEEVDAYFLAFHQQELGTIEETIKSLSPHRADLLSAAFDAHRNGQYQLAIPVFLSQADGIVKDSLGKDVQIFTSQGKRLKRQWEAVDQLPLAFITKAMVDIVRQGLPVGAGDFKSTFPHCINRHAILHGEDLEYGSEVNSHKAISLLAFVATTMPDIALARSEAARAFREQGIPAG